MALFQIQPGGPRLIGALDVGTTKVCCLIAIGDRGALQLAGIGHQRSRGLKSGMVVDADEAEKAVRAAVGQAERMAGVSLEQVTLAVSCGRLRSSTFTARAPIESRLVSQDDMDRIIAGGEAYLDRTGRSVVQLSRSTWCLDGTSGIADPRGLAGRELAIDLAAVTADDGPLRNLIGAVERGHLAVAGLVASPFASAIATATEEERRLGVLVVELGAGVTSLAAFAEGRLVLVDSVPVGGNHVTFDIARELATGVAEAERIKTLYGTLVKAASNESEVFSYQIAGEEDGFAHQTSKAFVREIVQPRIDGIMDLVWEKIAAAGIADSVTRRTVLTGGASQLIGIDQAWASRFDSLVRIGRPRALGRMPLGMCSPQLATAIGLVWAESEALQDASPLSAGAARGSRQGYLDRMQRWIRESF